MSYPRAAAEEKRRTVYANFAKTEEKRYGRICEEDEDGETEWLDRPHPVFLSQQIGADKLGLKCRKLPP